MKANIRVRIQFDTPPPILSSAKCFMMLINKDEIKFITDLEHGIAQKFGFASARSVHLSIEGYSLMSNDDIDVIRDGDEISVGIEHPSSSSNSSSPHADCTNSAVSAHRSDRKESKRLKGKKRKSSPSSSINSGPLYSKIAKVNIPVPGKSKSKKKSIKQGGITELLNGDKQKRNAIKSVSEEDRHTKKEKSHETRKKPPLKQESKPGKSEKKKRKSIQQGAKSPSKHMESSSDIHHEAQLSTPLKTNTKTMNTLPNTAFDKENMQVSLMKSKASQKGEKPPRYVTHKSPSKKKVDIFHNKSIITTCPDDNSDVSTKQASQLVEDYESLLSLSFPPRTGDLIAFKLLEISDMYTPDISGFKEANVIEVYGDSPANSSLKLDILWPPLSNEPKAAGKFDLVYDDEDLTNDQSNPQIVSWSCLVEPKLIS